MLMPEWYEVTAWIVVAILLALKWRYDEKRVSQDN
jgi:hypothetical protein